LKKNDQTSIEELEKADLELTLILHGIAGDVRKLCDMKSKKFAKYNIIECTILDKNRKIKFNKKDVYEISSEIIHAKRWYCFGNKNINSFYLK
jgi:hypothetical protein